jgi:hypothetical protein
MAALSLRSDLALCALAVVGVAADLACVLTGHPTPALFDQVALAGLTGAAGVALQARPTDQAAAGSTDAPSTYQAAQMATQVQQSPAVADPHTYTGPEGL